MGEGATATLNLRGELPQQLAVLGGDAQRTLQRSVEILLDSAQHGRHHRSVRHQELPGIRRAPDLLAGGFVERHQDGGAAGGDDEPVGFLQRVSARCTRREWWP